MNEFCIDGSLYEEIFEQERLDDSGKLGKINFDGEPKPWDPNELKITNSFQNIGKDNITFISF